MHIHKDWMIKDFSDDGMSLPNTMDLILKWCSDGNGIDVCQISNPSDEMSNWFRGKNLVHNAKIENIWIWLPF